MTGTEFTDNDKSAAGTSVSMLKTSDRGVISGIRSECDDVVRRLLAMGFVPGRPIRVRSAVSDKGARIVQIGDAVIALDLELASAIRVRTVGCG